MRSRKQYYVWYENDRVVCGSNGHTASGASTLRSARSVIRNIRKNDGYHPRNFKVYDTWVEGPAEVVYEEE